MPKYSDGEAVLVTGATGFVGRILCKRLLSEGISHRGTMMSSEDPSSIVRGVKPVVVESLGATTKWAKALEGISTIIHLAAKVHVMHEHAAKKISEFREINCEGTKQLGLEAAKAGVKRIVFVSTVKVIGEEADDICTERAQERATEAYGISKWEAEQALRQIESESGMEVVIVRSPLVYGPGVKANFLNMMKTIRWGIPLPLASIGNKRSMIYVGNLVDALLTCTLHPYAAGRTYFVSDGEDISTPELISRTARELGVSMRLLPFPTSLMHLAGRLTGKSAAVRRLTGSLAVDISKIRLELGWQPPFTMEEGLRETAKWFNSSRRS